MRFLFCSLESQGFLYPAIGLALALAGRGHEVAFAADLDAAPILSHHGLNRLPRGAQDGHSFQVSRWTDPLAVAIQVKHIEHALAEFPADALVGHCLTLGPLLVAERRRLPVAIQGFCTYLWPLSDRPAANTDKPELEARRSWRYQDMMRWFASARSLFRLPPWQGSCRESPLLGDLFLVRSVPELETLVDSLPERAHLVGSCLWEPEESDEELDAWLEQTERSGAPLIYVQHGRSFHIASFWRQLGEALGRRSCRVAASVGRLDGDLGAVPSNFFVRPHLPQGRILRAASAVVSSSNTTVVLGALSSGVPSVLIPAGGEQPDVAELCEEAGVALRLEADQAVAERIGQAVERLLAEDVYRERARHYRDAFAKTAGFELAVGLLELLAETRRPVLRTRSGPVGDRPKRIGLSPEPVGGSHEPTAPR